MFGRALGCLHSKVIAQHASSCTDVFAKFCFGTVLLKGNASSSGCGAMSG